MWAWEHPDWPNFVLEESPHQDRVDAFYRAAENLAGNVNAMSDEYRSDTAIELMLSETIATNAIEGENLDRHSVRSSLLAHFGREVAGTKPNDPRTEGATALIADVRRKWNAPLTRDLLGSWHHMIFSHRRRSSLEPVGSYRTAPMSIVSGTVSRERVHYVAPPANRVYDEMEAFFAWYNDRGDHLPGPIRATIAHAWFERIHPFDDGNGRIGRAVADHALSQSLGRPTLACLATAINENRPAYYRAFQRLDREATMDLSSFVEYFTGAIVRAQEISLREVDFVLDKGRFFERYRSHLNDRQTKVLSRMFEEGSKGFEGGMSTKKYMVIAKTPQATAARDLASLRDMKAMSVHGRGRNTRYTIRIPTRRQISGFPS